MRSTFSEYPRVQKKLLNGDYDVFGDGLVRILSTPGHTPGHQVLLVKLPSKGYVILTGDLYHLRQSRDERLVPVFNTSRAETLASIDRVERLAKNLKATGRAARHGRLRKASAISRLMAVKIKRAHDQRA
jgi:N-acyl homoserine lactone hydrolase